MGRLHDRVVLVFGAESSGDALSNGRAAALAYAAAGARVASIDINEDSAEVTAGQIRHKGGTAIAIAADVTDEGSVEAAVTAATEALDTPAVLHNNVGVTILGGVHTLSRESWDRAMALNATGASLTCKHTLPAMLEATTAPRTGGTYCRASMCRPFIGCDGSHVAPSSQRDIAEQIPDATLHVFPRDAANSHFTFLENPTAFNAVVEGFLTAG